MSKLKIKGEVMYSVVIDKEVDSESVNNKEAFEKELCFQGWEMIKNGDFTAYNVSYTKVI